MEVMKWLCTTAEKPKAWGWFHLMFLALVIILTVVLCIWGGARKKNEKAFKAVVWSAFGVMLIFEIYKQIVFSANFGADGTLGWEYQWYAFPFQLCSTPIYVLPIVGCLKDGKIRGAMVVFISTFAFFGGLATMLRPQDPFNTELLGVQIQTMVHHGLQIVLGIYFSVFMRDKIKIKNFFTGGAIAVFIAVLAIAMSLNAIVPLFVSDTFNMFYISPSFPCSLPILGDLIQPNVPYVVFLLIYIIGFVIVAFIMYLIFWSAIKLSRVLNSKI